MEKSYSQIVSLFHKDEILRKTIPTQSYNLDPDKFLRWKREASPDLVSQFKFIKIGFDDWLKALAKMFDQLLLLSNHEFIVSTGLAEVAKDQSASELWMTYIFKKFMGEQRYILEDYNEFWFICKNLTVKPTHRSILFIDDFVRTGAHMSYRILETPGLSEYLADVNIDVIICAAIMPDIEKIKEVLSDIGYNDLKGKEDLTSSLLKKFRTIAGRVLHVDEYPYILFDHTSGDKYDSEIFCGYLGRTIHGTDEIGSLVSGCDPLGNKKCPPPLYHLYFGSGRIPESSCKFEEIPEFPGYYKRIF